MHEAPLAATFSKPHAALLATAGNAALAKEVALRFRNASATRVTTQPNAGSDPIGVKPP
jgi:hypothetical protein